MYEWLALLAGLTFFFFYCVTGTSSKRYADARPVPGQIRFEVFRRDGAAKAIRYSGRAGFFAGICFSSFYYLCIPFFLMRYGLARTGIFFLIPTGCGLAIGMLPGMDDVVSMVLMQIPLRAATGVWIASREYAVCSKRLAQQGWVHVGCCRTISEKAATEVFFPVPPPPPGWRVRFMDKLRGA